MVELLKLILEALTEVLPKSVRKAAASVVLCGLLFGATVWGTETEVFPYFRVAVAQNDLLAVPRCCLVAAVLLLAEAALGIIFLYTVGVFGVELMKALAAAVSPEEEK